MVQPATRGRDDLGGRLCVLGRIAKEHDEESDARLPVYGDGGVAEGSSLRKGVDEKGPFTCAETMLMGILSA